MPTWLTLFLASVTFRANANQPYTVVFTRFVPDIEGKFTAIICSESCPVHVTPLMFTKPKASVKGEWRGATAGGCPNWLTWHRSPQYILHIPQTMNVSCFCCFGCFCRFCCFLLFFVFVVCCLLFWLFWLLFFFWTCLCGASWISRVVFLL